MSPEFIKAWLRYEEANARAADEYEAVPLCGQAGRVQRCKCGATALDNLCRACRKAGAS
jgi:hypothetical protein